MGQINHEPSMEDILASIKRIIAEDSEAAVTRPVRARREMAAVAAPSVAANEPAVEEEEGDAPDPVAAVEPESAAPAAPESLAETEVADVLELTSPLAEDAPQPKPAHSAPSPTTPPASPEAAIPIDRLMSDPAAQASRNAFAALSQMQVRAEIGAENTLEGLVADLLRPMLREWLDRELPSLVERMVQAEITRVSGRS
jgi:cell pole-organizing protein PopZ